MDNLCIVEHGLVLSVTGGRLKGKKQSEEVFDIPIETIEGISVFSHAQISTQCLVECMKRNIRISYFNSYGFYYGYTSRFENKEAERIKQQIAFFSNSLINLALSKLIIEAKINNQIVVARRYSKGASDEKIEKSLKMMKDFRKKIQFANSKNEIRGYEGISARYYFQILAKCGLSDFGFVKRKQENAKDPINALLNYGYSILYHEFHGEIENCGLTASIGFWHEDKNGHYSLASDLMEEWRSVLVDSVVMRLVSRKELKPEMFLFDDDNYVLSNEVKKLFIESLMDKMNHYSNYLAYINEQVSFRECLWHQVNRLKISIVNNTICYQPVRVR